MHIDNGSLVTITFALIKKRTIRVSFVGFRNDNQIAKSLAYNAFHGVIVPSELRYLYLSHGIGDE